MFRPCHKTAAIQGELSREINQFIRKLKLSSKARFNSRHRIFWMKIYIKDTHWSYGDIDKLIDILQFITRMYHPFILHRTITYRERVM